MRTFCAPLLGLQLALLLDGTAADFQHAPAGQGESDFRSMKTLTNGAKVRPVTTIKAQWLTTFANGNGGWGACYSCARTPSGP
jgi:hypothetical protein